MQYLSDIRSSIGQEHEKPEAEVKRKFELKQQQLLKDYQARKAAAMNAAADAARAPAPALHQEQQTPTQLPATHPFAGEEYRPRRMHELNPKPLCVSCSFLRLSLSHLEK
jgi:hypothetical protein